MLASTKKLFATTAALENKMDDIWASAGRELQTLRDRVLDLEVQAFDQRLRTAIARGTAKLTPGTRAHHRMFGPCLIIQRPKGHIQFGADSGIELIWCAAESDGRIFGAHPDRLSIL